MRLAALQQLLLKLGPQSGMAQTAWSCELEDGEPCYAVKHQ
jgi:hypothetical protein